MDTAESPRRSRGVPRERRYVRAPVPIHFPSEAKVPESRWHLDVRTALYLILRRELSVSACVGSDQFVYWDPTAPRRCRAPDVFVRTGARDETFAVWKVWERGAPQLAVEIASPNDDAWEAHLADYHVMGVEELVRFDRDAADAPLRVWDRVEGDLVERILESPRVAECGPLGLFWVIADDPELGPALRLARDPEGSDLLPTPQEAEARAEQERAALARRVSELEERLAQKGR